MFNFWGFILPLKTGKEYVESIRKMKSEVYANGIRLEELVDHPLIRPHVNAAAMTYELAHYPEYEDLMTAKSHLTREKINRFTHIHQSTEDLVKKVKMLRLLGQHTGTCFQRCVGLDAMNALYIITFDIDKKKGTPYHERFRKFLINVQRNDLMCDGAMTDPKGDRSLSPCNQADPDLYLRIVEEREGGLIVRGAKAHQTGAVNSHEIIVMPTAALNEADKKYAVSFAMPSDSEGIMYIFGRQTNDSRKLEDGDIDKGNINYGFVGGEALVIFEDVFVPKERVFMCGEFDFSGSLVETFASFHRQNYGGCKVGLSDVLIGATSAMAEYNGVANASHVRDKITEMVHLAESLYCGSIACSSEGQKTPSGAYYVNPLLANIVKQNVTRNIYEICRLSHDISGGVLATLPYEKDLKDPKIGKYLEKYLKGVATCPTENRIRMARLIENMTGGTSLVESMHGAGSPQAQRIMIFRRANLDRKKKLALRISGIEKDEYIEKIRSQP